ncbi:hypothetical protein ADILRU_0286 [Leifsonia rubra CMS 76R]|nr:hypothetical protein ADILRU_0286 [Leifsonia rubra CMS 76R]
MYQFFGTACTLDQDTDTGGEMALDNGIVVIVVMSAIDPGF